MFRKVFRSPVISMTAAASAAAFVGSSYLSKNNTQCEKKKDDSTTVVGLLQGLTASVQRMEGTLGTFNNSPVPSKTKHGIDVVLGAQWGDEGKGKLVDILSQVSFDRYPTLLLKVRSQHSIFFK
jgi:hypothetical protein